MNEKGWKCEGRKHKFFPVARGSERESAGKCMRKKNGCGWCMKRTWGTLARWRKLYNLRSQLIVTSSRVNFKGEQIELKFLTFFIDLNFLGIFKVQLLNFSVKFKFKIWTLFNLLKFSLVQILNFSLYNHITQGHFEQKLLLIFYYPESSKKLNWIPLSVLSIVKLFLPPQKTFFFSLLHRPFKCLTLLIIVQNLFADNYQIFPRFEKNRWREKKISSRYQHEKRKFLSLARFKNNFIIFW